MTIKTYKKQQGLTLIETLFYLIIIISVAAGSITYFKASSRAQKLANAVSETADMLQIAAQYWESNMTFEGLTDKIAIKSGLIPVKYTNLSERNTGKIATPWTEINSDSKVSFEKGNTGSIDIVFSGIPNYACAPLAQQLTNIGYTITKECSGYGEGGGDSNMYNSTVTISVQKR